MGRGGGHATVGCLTASNDEIFERFKVVELCRRHPFDRQGVVVIRWSGVAEQAQGRENTDWATPLIVMDTISANIDLDNISDNSDHTVRSRSSEKAWWMSTLMVGHMAKAMTRSSGQ